MPAGQRPLPTRPSLRYLRLEAKRRLATGEFPALHDAQEAIAREYGLLGWAALKQHVTGARQEENHALPHLRWVIARFSGAGEPGWTAPGEDEVRAHFSGQLLALVPPTGVIAGIVQVAPVLREELVVAEDEPLWIRAQIGGGEVVAAAEAEPPHLLSGLTFIPLGGRITDTRVTAAAPARSVGDVPAEVAAIADEAFRELGLPGLILAGDDGTGAWVLAKGWANLDRDEALDPCHRLPATGITALVTAVAVLCLVADRRVGPDCPANEYLRTVRLADDTVTVRELLSHSGGLDDVPADPREVFADSVPSLATVTGPVIGCGGARGVLRPVNSGCAALGQIVADVTGSAYPDAAAQLVLRPLGMRHSSFPARADGISPGGITGYTVTAAGGFVPVPAAVCVLPAAGGLWSTAADLVRLGTGWASLLPAELAREALTPRAAPPGIVAGQAPAGFGWLVRPRGETAFVSGSSLDSVASLSVRIRDGRTHLVVVNRAVPVDTIEDRLLRAWTNPTARGMR